MTCFPKADAPDFTHKLYTKCRARWVWWAWRHRGVSNLQILNCGPVYFLKTRQRRGAVFGDG